MATDNLPDHFAEVADAIRAVDGTTGKINPQDFASRILALAAGGGVSDHELRIFFDETKPAELYGGTWEELPQGTFIMAAGNGGTAGQTGGSNTHTNSVEEMAPHHHQIMTATIGWLSNEALPNGVLQNQNYYPSMGVGANATFTDNYQKAVDSHFIVDAGGGKAYDSRPQFMSFHIWRKAA